MNFKLRADVNCGVCEPLEGRQLLAAIVVGNFTLQPNLANQTVQLRVTGGDAIQGENVNVQIADGGPEAGGTVRGPRITKVDLFAGTIFASNNTGQRGGGALVPQVYEATTTAQAGTVAASGVLAIVTLDTTGLSSGTFDFKLAGTVNGNTDFAGVPLTITNGKITIAGSPPPALPVVTLSAIDASAAETGPDSAAFRLSRAGSAAAALTVNYSIGGTATNGSDYNTLTGTATLAVGSSSATITLTPKDDKLIEGPETATLTLSSAATYTVGTPAATTVTIADNDFAAGSIAGTVFNDANANAAKESAEKGIAAVRVYVDANNNGAFDASETNAKTDSAGNYKLTGLAGGKTYRIRSATPSGYRLTAPASAYYDVALGSGTNVSARTFGLTQRVFISGSVFDDKNKNGKVDTGENGLSSRRVYLDANSDGKYQSSEASVLTDASGNWRLDNLAAGKFVVRTVVPSGRKIGAPSTGYYSFTLTAGQISFGRLFGERAI